MPGYKAALALCATALLGCSTASGQGNSAPAERPAFDAASVKADPSLSLRHVLLPPAGGRLSTRMASLQLLIQNAYGVQSFQVSGGPDWMNSSGYDVEARAEGNPSRSQVWLMLQSLLEDRFKLKVHRETKVLPVFALTAAKSGLKLPPPKEGDCVDASAPAVPPVSGQRPLPPCGEAQVGFEPATGLFVAGGQVAMAELIRVLSGLLQRPIVDETGFLQKFDIDLRFAYEEGVTAVPNPWRQSDSGRGGDPAANPSINDGSPATAGIETGIDEGASRSPRHRSRGEAFGELSKGSALEILSGFGRQKSALPPAAADGTICDGRAPLALAS